MSVAAQNNGRRRQALRKINGNARLVAELEFAETILGRFLFRTLFSEELHLD